MTKLVLLHRADSIYEDEPDVKYDFPRTYLKAMSEAVGDWVIYYEPVKAGKRGYFAVAQIKQIVERPDVPGRFWAFMEPDSFLQFDKSVPRLIKGRALEAALMLEDGTLKKGGAQQLAVRRLPESDFARIVDLGLPADLEEVEQQRYAPKSVPVAGTGVDRDRRFEVDDPAAPFMRPVVERLTRRAYRDVAFRRRVREAYGFRCALSGLRLRNGGGRPEVQAAHIRPVNREGSDSVRNGLALSGTLHWMFDRGLISVAEDHTILISRNKVPSEVVDRLIVPDGKLWRPDDPQNHPHPENLRWHRENVFGQVVADDPADPAPWS